MKRIRKTIAVVIGSLLISSASAYARQALVIQDSKLEILLDLRKNSKRKQTSNGYTVQLHNGN